MAQAAIEDEHDAREARGEELERLHAVDPRGEAQDGEAHDAESGDGNRGDEHGHAVFASAESPSPFRGKACLGRFEGRDQRFRDHLQRPPG